MSQPLEDAYHDLQVLIDVARRLGETFELGPLLKAIEVAGRTALNCDRATIFLYDPDSDELYSTVATGTGEIRFPAKMGIAGETARTRRVIHVPDAYADPRFNQDIDRRTGYRTRNILSLPLIAPDGQMMGVLQVLNKLDGAFGEHDIRIAEALGSLTGIAIKRQMLLDSAAVRQRLERDLKIAREIQEQLLPQKLPTIPGYDVAGWNKPAEETGGDLYDVMQLDTGHLAFMIADATGHGIGPALIVGQCRAILRALVGTSEDPVQIAVKTNNLLYQDLPDDRFVTCCFGVVNPAENQLYYVSAGHAPLLLYRAATGEVESHPSTGLPMGILLDTELEMCGPVDLAPGDMFILLTDGFMEWARADGQQYGEERLAEMIRRHCKLPCSELIQAIYEDVRAFGAGSPQLDDLTAVLVKRRES